MAANRKVGALAGALVAGVLLLNALFAVDPVAASRPESLPESGCPGALPEIPAVAPVPPSAAVAGPFVRSPRGRSSARRIPVEVEVVDAETGRRLPGARPILIAGDWVRLVGDRGLFRHPDATVVIGRPASLRFLVDLPPGYAMEDPERFVARGMISRYTERVRVTIPAWPLARVQVQVLDHLRNPVAGATIDFARFLDRMAASRSKPTGRDGRTWVEALPALRGERLSICMETALRHATVSGRIEDGATPLSLAAVLPEEENGSGWCIGGSSSGGFSTRSRTTGRPVGGEETMVVTVRHREGWPASNTLVIAESEGGAVVGRTDGKGRLVLSGLAAGRYSLTVGEPGFSMGAPVTVDLAAGSRAVVAVCEAAPRWITGVVIGETGRPLPSATVTVDSTRNGNVVWLHRGLQRLNLLAGPDGRFDYPNVPPGHATVRARYGTRSASVEAGAEGPLIVDFARR